MIENNIGNGTMTGKGESSFLESDSTEIQSKSMGHKSCIGGYMRAQTQPLLL